MMWKFILLSIVALCFAHLIFLGGRNLILLILIIETLFLCLSLAFVTTYYENALSLPNHNALFYGIALIVLSAAESAILLALIARIYRKSGTILVKSVMDEDERKEKAGEKKTK